MPSAPNPSPQPSVMLATLKSFRPSLVAAGRLLLILLAITLVYPVGAGIVGLYDYGIAVWVFYAYGYGHWSVAWLHLFRHSFSDPWIFAAFGVTILLIGLGVAGSRAIRRMNSARRALLRTIALPVLGFLALVTALYPTAADLSGLAGPSPASWSWIAWHGGHWFLLWEHIFLYWPPGPQVVQAAGLAFALAVGVCAFGFLALLKMGLLGWDTARKPNLSRKQLRGPKLVDRPDMPERVIALAGISIHPKDEKARRRWMMMAQKLTPDQATVAAMLKKAIADRRPLSRAEAVAEARVNMINQEAVKAGLIRFGNLPIPPAIETYHGLICASTGTGKSVALRQLIGDLRRRGDRVIVVDAGYDMSKRFRRKDDIVLSPFDPDGVGWNLRNEIKAPHEWQTFAASVFPAGEGESGEWAKRARSFFANACMKAGNPLSNKEIYDLMTQVDTTLLQEAMNLEKSATFDRGAEGILGSVRSIIETNLAAWQFAKDGDFSCREYMLGDSRKWLWLPYRDSDKGTLGPAIGAWLDMLILAGLERVEAVNDAGIASLPKTWLIIDELDSIGAINSLKDAVTRLRKSNIAIICAVQDYNQLVARYGMHDAATLFGNFSNRLFLRCKAAGLAKMVSEELGMVEFEETRIQTGENQSAGGRTSSGMNSSTAVSYVKSEIVLASEIQNLPTLEGYVVLADVNEIFRVTQSLSPD